MSVGNDLKRFREERSLSRKSVCERLEWKIRTLTDYENDKIDIPLSKFMQLLDVYHVDFKMYTITKEDYICLKGLEDITIEKIYRSINDDAKYKK